MTLIIKKLIYDKYIFKIKKFNKEIIMLTETDKFKKKMGDLAYLIEKFVDDEDYEEEISQMNVLDSRRLHSGKEDELVYELFLNTTHESGGEVIDVLVDRIRDEWASDSKFERALVILQIIYSNRLKEVMYSQSKTIEMNSNLKWLNKQKKSWVMDGGR
jgi:hypothetical protein